MLNSAISITASNLQPINIYSKKKGTHFHFEPDLPPALILKTRKLSRWSLKFTRSAAHSPPFFHLAFPLFLLPPISSFGKCRTGTLLQLLITSLALTTLRSPTATGTCHYVLIEPFL